MGKKLALVDVTAEDSPYKNYDPEVLAEASRISAEMKSRSTIAPAGTLGLPELLDQRRIQYDIPDGAFWGEAAFDRVVVYQIDRAAGETFENSLIARPQISKAREREECPVGIIVSAGMHALDSLRSNGVDLGHIVVFVHLAPFRFQCDTIDGKAVHVLLLRSGDIILSHDLREKTKSKEWEIRTWEHRENLRTPPATLHYLDKGNGSVTIPNPNQIFEE